jgi:hypothetical protein
MTDIVERLRGGKKIIFSFGNPRSIDARAIKSYQFDFGKARRA